MFVERFNATCFFIKMQTADLYQSLNFSGGADQKSCINAMI